MTVMGNLSYCRWLWLFLAGVGATGVTVADSLVAQLKDGLASGQLKHESSSDAIEAAVRAASHEGKMQELLKHIKLALNRELLHGSYEVSRASALAEMERLQKDFKGCHESHHSLNISELKLSHRSCREQEATKWSSFHDCGAAGVLCRPLEKAYQLQRQNCDQLQDRLDQAICSSRGSGCHDQLACEAHILETMYTARDTMEAMQHEHMGLVRAQASVECLLSKNLHEDVEFALTSCRRPETMRSLRMESPALPQLSRCPPPSLLEVESSYEDLPPEAPAKGCSSACCMSLLQVDPYDAEDYEHQYNEAPPISLEGCTAWFKAEEAAVPWPSVVGSHEGKVVGKKAEGFLEVGHGAKKNVKFLRGDEKTRFDFGEVLDESYTICSVTRYTGEPYGRILQGSEENWLHGQSKQNTGVSCAVQETPANIDREDWVVVCAASDNSDALVNGKKVSQQKCNNIKVKQNLVINHGKKWQEVSSWAVMEVIVWNKILDAAKMQQASEYLMGKLVAGVQEDYKITKADGNCNGRRVQVQLQVSPDGWRHSADGGDPSDMSLYPASGESFGAVKIVEDAMQIVSEKNVDEISPWAHSSLRGKAFVIMGNSEGPRTLSFFAMDRNLTVRIWVNGSEVKDLELAHGTSGYFRGQFQYARVLAMGTSNFLMFMSGEDQKFSTPVAPAAKSIYGSCAGEWYVTNLKGNVTSIKQECSDGTSYTYEGSTVNWRTHNAIRGTKSSSSLVATRGVSGWYKTGQYKTCNATCTAAALNCSTDSSLLSSSGKIKVAMSELGETCDTVEDPQNGTRAGSFRKGANGNICSPASEKTPLDCNLESDATRICFCTAADEVYKLAPKGSNVCPDQYRAIESSKDCFAAAGTGMQGLPPPSIWETKDPNNQGSPSSCFKDLETGKVRFNSIAMRGYEQLDAWQTADHRKICKKAFSGPEAEPSCKFTALEDQIFLGGVSYDKPEHGGSAVTFMPPGVFQMDTKMPFGITQIKLISDKNATCKIKGKNYKLYGNLGVFSLRLKERKLQAADVIACNQNVMAVGFRDISSEPEATAEPRLNLLGATACHAASMRGVGGLVLDNVLHLEPGFVFVKTLGKNELANVATISKEEFDTLVEPWNKYPVVKRLCPSCAASHTEIVYRRYTPMSGFSAYESMACSWSEDAKNVEGKDFKLFSNLNDAFGDTNKWSVCGYNSTRGFPGECGPSTLVSEQWNSIPVNAGSSTGKCTTDGGGRAVSFYNFLPIVPQKFRLGLAVDQDGEITSLSEADFNRRFQQSRYHIILRKCQSCKQSHRYIFYRRLTNTDTYEPFKSLACDWESAVDNVFMVDFKLYSDLQDALADNNPWDFCGFDGSGFPGTCSPDGKAQLNQANNIAVTGCEANETGKAVTFELLEDEVLEVEELEAEEEETEEIKDAVLPSGTVAAEGLVAWFRSEDAGPTWKSSVGSFKAEVNRGLVRSGMRHYGSEMKHIYGDSKASFGFGDILHSTFTICSLSAYTGIAQGKILRAEDWWHGHNKGHAGSVFYGGKWVHHEQSLNGTRSWIALCASNQLDYVFLDGVQKPGKFVGVGGHALLGINDGPTKEHSDWAVAEVITWDRVLTRSEMVEAQNYLRAKAKVCQPEQAAQCDSAPCVSLFVGPNQHNVIFRNEDGTATVKTYLGAEIPCVCKGHCLGLVGSWQCDGGPYGGLYRITAGYADDWTPETNRDSILLCTVARPIWQKKGELSSMALEVGSAKTMLQATSFTFTATVRRDSGGGPLTLFSSGHDTSVPSVDLRMVSNADLTFGFSFSGESCDTAVTEGSQEGEWQHLAFVYDLDKNETRIYLNALEVQLCSFQYPYVPETASLMIGAYKGNARWIGAMKDIAIYAETLSTALIGRLAGELAVPKAMVWFSFLDGWNQQSYVEAVSYCAKRHMKLAHFDDYCLLKDGNFSVNPHVAPGDQWAPYAGAEENSWVQVGNGYSTMKPSETCKTYLESYGQRPKWGMDGKPYRYKSYLACKAPFGFIMHPSRKGLGTCLGDALTAVDQAKSQASCRMNCIKQTECKYASWTESADGDASCLLFSKCSWSASESSTTWVKKPLG